MSKAAVKENKVFLISQNTFSSKPSARNSLSFKVLKENLEQITNKTQMTINVQRRHFGCSMQSISKTF
jgi:hypothetical protein